MKKSKPPSRKKSKQDKVLLEGLSSISSYLNTFLRMLTLILKMQPIDTNDKKICIMYNNKYSNFLFITFYNKMIGS